MIIIHVIAALTALLLSVLSLLSPSKLKIIFSYILITSTLISGSLLIIVNQVSIVRTCITGVIFLAVTLYLTVAANNKLMNKALLIILMITK